MFCFACYQAPLVHYPYSASSNTAKFDFGASFWRENDFVNFSDYNHHFDAGTNAKYKFHHVAIVGSHQLVQQAVLHPQTFLSAT